MATINERNRTRRYRPNLIRGFDSLTLDPSPRLRRRREAISRRNRIAEAWKITAAALAAAVDVVKSCLPRQKQR